MVQPGTDRDAAAQPPLTPEGLALFGALPTPSLVLDALGGIRHVNPAFERLTGHEAAILIHQGFDLIRAPHAPAPDLGRDGEQVFQA